MGTIKALYDRVNQVDLRNEVPRIITDTSFEIEALNKEQLYSGLSVDGLKIEPYKDNRYAEMKHTLNPLPGYGVMDFFVTGTFYKGFFVTVKMDAFIVDSRDSKTSRLENKGFEIFGLSKESKQKYAFGVFHEYLRRYIEGLTGLKFR